MIKKEIHSNVSELVRNARLKQGFATLKELFRERMPTIDYQTWLHAEAGRRLPHPDSLKQIAAVLDIEREDLIIAYCKDKFSDAESLGIIDSFKSKKFIDVETLVESKDHDSRVAYTYNANQTEELKKDHRIALFLIYTYDKNLKTSLSRLSAFFKVDKDEVTKVINKARELGLVEVNGDEVIRVHRYVSLPATSETVELRRALLAREIECNVKQDSYFNNIHTILSDESFKKIIAYLYFAEANIVKLAKEERPDRKTSRVQIALVANKISEEFTGETK